jgi:hypothetical protein
LAKQKIRSQEDKKRFWDRAADITFVKYNWISTVILTGGTMEQVGISIGFEFEVEWVEDLVKNKDGKDGAEGKIWCWIGLSMWHLMMTCKRWVMVLMPPLMVMPNWPDEGRRSTANWEQ